MFGGVAFLVLGNMVCGPLGKRLLVRIGEASAAEAIKKPHVKPMTFTGRVMKTFAENEPADIESDAPAKRVALTRESVRL